MEQLQEEFLVNYPNRTFVTYKEMRIFYEYTPNKYQPQQWFVIIYITGDIQTYSCVGCDWAYSKQEAIEWGVAKIDEYIANHTKTERGWLPNYLFEDK
ncbi:hypothetical protein NIES2101_42675 [Calothrix sp. HK-06]|nr:hypothetical protein NIES2101_42675 [Calothrix sp. HK-06]